jgi:hypothetical protein
MRVGPTSRDSWPEREAGKTMEVVGRQTDAILNAVSADEAKKVFAGRAGRVEALQPRGDFTETLFSWIALNCCGAWSRRSGLTEDLLITNHRGAPGCDALQVALDARLPPTPIVHYWACRQVEGGRGPAAPPVGDEV